MDKGNAKKPAESVPSPISENEEQEIIPSMTKRKRSSPVRIRISYVPQTSSALQYSTISIPQNITDSYTPSPDEDDHLTIKRLKIKHSVQTLLEPLQPSPTPLSTFTPEIMNLDNSNEEQDLHGLRTSIFNKFPSLLPQTITILPSLVQPESESKIKQPEQSMAEQTIEQTDRPKF